MFTWYPDFLIIIRFLIILLVAFMKLYSLPVKSELHVPKAKHPLYIIGYCIIAIQWNLTIMTTQGNQYYY